MDWQSIRALDFVEEFLHFPVIESTNSFALSRTCRPQQGISVIVADCQSAGRGRRGNSFFSALPKGLFCSCVVLISDLSNHFVINRGLACAITAALRKQAKGAALTIKWPNDIFCNQKKICGILLESAPSTVGCIVAGFGINVNLDKSDFPADIAELVTSLMLETGRTHTIVTLCHDVLLNFWKFIHEDQALMHARYVAELLGLGAEVEINGERGTFASIEPDGRFCLVNRDQKRYFISGSPKFLK